MTKFLPGLTTTPKSNWRGKIREIDEFGIEEAALFPTFLELPERKELYALLEKSGLKRAPHVHLRNDMEVWELDYFKERWSTEVFNVHFDGKIVELPEARGKYHKMIFIENQKNLGEEFFEALEFFGGLCLDCSHWEYWGKDCLESLENLARKYKIGCAHISSKKYAPRSRSHWLFNLKDLDYMKKYLRFLPEYASIELENSFREQSEAKKYLEKML